MRFGFFPLLILAICFLTYPGKRLSAQQPNIPAKPLFGQIRSNSTPAAIEGTMRAFLNRRMIAKNPTGTAGTSKTVAGDLTLQVLSSGTTCGASNGSFNVTVLSGGTPPFQYSENGYPPQATGFFPEKAPGTYNILVTDANGLTGTATVTLTNTYAQPDPVYIYTYTNATGCAGADGSVTVTASGGTPPYEFSIDDVNFQTTNVFSNLIPGDYSFFVRDANGCENVKYFPLGRNCKFSIGYAYSGSICHPGDGYIEIRNVSGGTAPYSYSDDGIHFQSSGSFTGYSFGRHVIYIKDADGTLLTYSFPIYQFCPIDVSVIATPPTCGQQNGSITAAGTNGQAPYTYSLDGINFQSNNIFTSLASGNYTVTVKDAIGLRATASVFVPSGCPSVEATTVNDICARSIGSAEASGKGGTPPYLYSIDGTNFQSNPAFTGLMAGNYILTIRDKNNFTATTSFAISSFCPVVNASPINSTCGYANGRIIATGTDGLAPYQYSLDGANFQASGTFTDLSPATYTVYVRDAAGGESQTTAVVGNDVGPSVRIVGSPASCDDNDGMLTVTATGGSLPLAYSIDGNSYQNGPVFSSLASGAYTAYVKDANGCLTQQAATIAFINTVAVDAGGDQAVCQGRAIQLKGQSNVSNYSWTPAGNLDNPESIHPMASPTETTKYYLTASWGICSRIDSMIVLVNRAPLAFTGGDTAICLGKSIQIHGSGGGEYSWTPSQYLDNPRSADPMVASPATSVLYHLVVTDQIGCQSLNDATIAVTVTPLAQVDIGKDTSIAIGEPLQLHAIDVNNSNFNSFVWSPSFGLDNPYSQNPVAVLDQNTAYTLTATAPGGCTAHAKINVRVYKGPDIYVPNAFSPNGDGHNDVLKAIPIGIARFQYFSVFSRWGQPVFNTTNPTVGWNGRFNGNPQPPDTYVWMAGGVDYQGKTIERKGSVILIR